MPQFTRAKGLLFDPEAFASVRRCPVAARNTGASPMQGLLMGLSIFVAATAEESPRVRYEALVKEFDAAHKSAVEAVSRAANDREEHAGAYSLGRSGPKADRRARGALSETSSEALATQGRRREFRFRGRAQRK
jgi:hypothetical protein